MTASKEKKLPATTRKIVAVMAVISYFYVFAVSLYAEVGKATPGQANTVFDKAFLQSIRNVLLFEQVEKIVGTAGIKVGSSTLKIPGEKYHWNGQQNSSLNIRVNSGKVVDANVVAPEGNILTLDGNGEVIDFGK